MRFAIWVFLLFIMFPLEVYMLSRTRAANVLFAKVGRFGSEGVILELDWRCAHCLKEYYSLLTLQK